MAASRFYVLFSVLAGKAKEVVDEHFAKGNTGRWYKTFIRNLVRSFFICLVVSFFLFFLYKALVFLFFWCWDQL